MDELLEALNGTDIPFADTAWLEAPSGSYGVARITGMDGVHADDTCIFGYYTGSVDLYCVGHGRDEREDVQEAMDTVDTVEWSFPTVEYLPESNQTHWSWSIRLWQE